MSQPLPKDQGANASTAEQRSVGEPLTLYGISHSYGGDGLAVDDVTLDVAGGELVALLGPSGCGKSTLLLIVTEFLYQSQGHVKIGDRFVDALPPTGAKWGSSFKTTRFSRT